MSSSTKGVPARKLALKALLRIETGGAYANLVLPKLLGDSELSERDRAFVTEMVYGTTRMRRAVDHLIEPYLITEIDDQVRAALRLGAYQLHFMETAPHAAVNATVGAARGKGRTVVNAVLRRLAKTANRFSALETAAEAVPRWPSEAVRLSYPDWIVDRLITDIGERDALASLEAMNVGAQRVQRCDGYTQDLASQEVVDTVKAERGELIVDLCSAPGGKATGMAASGAQVIAGDRLANRARLVASNAVELGQTLSVLVADGTRPPLRAGVADAVLVDAPCSGLGSLRRRADARWRIDSQAPERLAKLQSDLVLAGLNLLKPGGRLVYSVCTLTTVETEGVLAAVQSERSDVVLEGDVVRRLPDQSDGMVTVVLRLNQ